MTTFNHNLPTGRLAETGLNLAMVVGLGGVLPVVLIGLLALAL